MNNDQLAGKFLMSGGIAELVIAVVHFLMPLSIDRSAKISGVPAEYRSYLWLATFAVGACMLAFGVLSIFFARRTFRDESAWRFFSFTQGLLWVVRAILELILPVKIPLFFLSNPTMVILPVALLIAILFLWPVLGIPKGLPD